MREIKMGGLYKHFKGHIYRVVRIGYDSEKYDDNNPEANAICVAPPPPAWVLLSFTYEAYPPPL